MSSFLKSVQLLAVILCSMVLPPASQAQTRPLVIGQIIPLSGPLANVGKEIQAVTQASFEMHNRKGGQTLELRSIDDGNQADQSAELAKQMSPSVAGFLSCFGSVGCLAQQKVAAEARTPLIGPMAGASALRGKSASMSFAVRASAADEVRALLRYMQVMGMQNMSVVVQDDGFGKSYESELNRLIPQFPTLKFHRVELKPTQPEYAAVVKALTAGQPHGLLLLANAVHSTGVLTAWRQKDNLPFVFNLAGQANSLFANRLKGYTGAAAFVTVTPNPWGSKTTLQRDYQSLVTAYKLESSYLGFEAFINARLLIEALSRNKISGREDLARALEGMHGRDLGGYLVDYSGGRLGSRFTDLALLRPDGSYRH